MHEVATCAERAVLPAVVIVLSIAVYTDCRWRLIHNALTLPFMTLGLLLHFAGRGWYGLGWALLGAAAGFALMAIPYVFGQMGGGDVKLLAALGSLLGAYAVLNVFLYSTLAGGALAVVYAARHHEGLSTLKRAGQLAAALVTRRTDSPSTRADDRAITIPYGVAIAAGTLLYLGLGKVV